jgi:hypothetical protein
MNDTNSEVQVRMPGSSVIAAYENQRERDQALCLAEARQALAHAGVGYVPPWAELTEDEREKAALEARSWLRAAISAGIALDQEAADINDLAHKIQRVWDGGVARPAVEGVDNPMARIAAETVLAALGIPQAAESS